MNKNQKIFSNLHFAKKTRIDKIIASLLENESISRSRAQKLIETGSVQVNDTCITDPSQNFQTISKISILLPDPEPTDIIPKDTISFKVIYEDEHILVIEKPAGITTHPGAGNFHDTLANELVSYCGTNLSGVGGIMRPGIVHRLDKDTSGIMIVAKDDISHLSLSSQLQSRELARKYYALTYGTPNPKKSIITTEIARDRYNRQKMAVVQSGGKIAITEYEVVENFRNQDFSLLSCSLKTGRTHQIRLHMSHIGHGIIGDQTYGGRNKLKYLKNYPDLKEIIPNINRQMLHAYHIGFIHPKSQNYMEFTIDIAEDMQGLIKALLEEGCESIL